MLGPMDDGWLNWIDGESLYIVCLRLLPLLLLLLHNRCVHEHIKYLMRVGKLVGYKVGEF